MLVHIMSGKKEFKNISRLQRARSEILHTSTAGSIRNNIRNRFFNRLKSNRSRSVDRFREIVENYGELLSYRSISDLRRVLESDSEASSIMRESEVNQLLNEIEQELAQVELQDEADQHVSQTQTETEDILSRHLFTCKICENQNFEGEVCDKCKINLQREFSE